MSLRGSLVVGALVATVPSCGPGGPAFQAHPGCINAARTYPGGELAVGQTLRVAPPCTQRAAMYVIGPVKLSATDEGLHIEMDVVDHSRDPLRDRAVVYPAGAAPGDLAIELASEPTATGYHVDDVVRWSAWGLPGADGTIHFKCIVLDRAENNGSARTEVVLYLRIRPSGA